jgi:fructose-bisphosphate aldolase class II
MRKLSEILRQVQNERTAIGHFSVADLVLIKAVMGAARELNLPVLVGASEGERDFMGTRQLAAVVSSLREEFDFPIFLNADHTHSLAEAAEAAKAGVDAVVFDLSTLPFEENAKQTKDAVEALKSINPEILVEGEIGDFGSGSEIHDDAPRPTPNPTTASEARQFAQATRIDTSVGNAHGMRRKMVACEEKKHLNVDRIRAIKEATSIPLTLPGGSGTAGEDLRKAIRAGINIVHINTELRLAWRHGLEDGLHQREYAIVPYKVLPSAVASVQQVVSSRLKLFTNPVAEIHAQRK